MDLLHAAAGLVLLLALAWAMSEDRRAVRWRVVLPGLALMGVLAALLLLVPPLRDAVFSLSKGLEVLEKATQAGAQFVFGPLADPSQPFVLAFRALPLLLVVSALSALLFYWRILPVVVKAFSWLLERTLGIGGAVGLSAAANVLMGMVEAPLVVKPYLVRLSRSELFMVMACGMATTAGTVMALYAAILGPVVPAALGHIFIASIVATPAAIVVAALMVPGGMTREEGVEIERQDTSAMDAITRGTLEGVQLLLYIVAMLIVLIALVYLVNAILALLPAPGGAPLTLQRMLGWVFSPLAWMCGVPWAEAQAAGALLGTKTALNEFIAYIEMSKLPAEALSPRSRLLMTYALCGFANFGSAGILIGGMGAMVPQRRAEIVALSMKSIAAGTIATCLTAAMVGLFI